MTLYQLWGVSTPTEAEARLAAERVAHCKEDPINLKSWLLSQVGEEIYRTFYEGYTTKQWGRDPEKLPASIVTRIPIRLTFDDNYFEDRYQGIPQGGYSKLIGNMLQDVEVKLGCDYFEDISYFNRVARKIVYTGPIDRFFDYRYGRLEYRSLRFEEETLTGDFQGVAAVNYTSLDIPYTRIVEHKHFDFIRSDTTVITREYPLAAGSNVEPFYPVNDAANNAIYHRYQQAALASPILFGGRLATYKYYDMHHVIGQALSIASREGLGRDN